MTDWLDTMEELQPGPRGIAYRQQRLFPLLVGVARAAREFVVEDVKRSTFTYDSLYVEALDEAIAALRRAVEAME